VAASRGTDGALRDLGAMKSLKGLLLGNCREITDAGLFELRDLNRLKFIGLQGHRKDDRGNSKTPGSEEDLVSEGKLSSRGARIVKALNQLADDLAAGTPIEAKYTVRQVRVIPKPLLYPPAQVRALRELIGASQEVFAQLLAVSPMSIRS
jgi:DNA-binding transcriptional regulator YiaG